MAERGRPSVYTEDIAIEVCDRLAAGESLNSICTDAHLPGATTIRRWAILDHEGFSAQYARARELQARHEAEKLMDIADGLDPLCSDVQRDRLRVDTRKWWLSKLLPKQYGDKVDVTHSGQLNVGVLRVPERLERAEWTNTANRLPAHTNGSNGDGT